ncbi:hypothetical protein Ndes2437A_g03128 [Nannochloris sp. 'desiccata']
MAMHFSPSPKARNALANSYYCPHCLNAGGVAATRGTKYPNNSGKHGICGDRAAGPLDHEAGGKFATGEIAATYKQGSAIQLAAAMATYHKGLIEYRICRYQAGSPRSERAALTNECLEQHVLKQASSSQAPGSRYYFLGNASDAGYDPPRLFYHNFQLPQGLVCDGNKWKCVLQMHYITGNTCNDPAIPDEYKLSYLATCGEDGNQWPEEFWNCADVAILPKGSSKPREISQADASQPAFSPAPMQGPSTGAKATSLSEYKLQHPSLFAFVVHRKFYPSAKGSGAEAKAVQQEDDDKPRSWRRAMKSAY